MISVFVAVAVSTLSAEPFPPFKDSLFRYPATLSSSNFGDRMFVDYSQKRDIEDRDEIDVEKVKSEYVDETPSGKVREFSTRTPEGRPAKYLMLLPESGKAESVVVYMHGAGGNRFQGMNDRTFGGNFNRIKNLAYRGNSAYVTTESSDFGDRGYSEVSSAVADALSKASPGAKLFVAGGSSGGTLLWRLSKDGRFSGRLAGLALLGSVSDSGFLKSDAFKARVPVYLGHGGSDRSISWKAQDSFFRSVKAADPKYPIRLTVFVTGTHGTPIRMSDWRKTLNWMIAVGTKNR